MAAPYSNHAFEEIIKVGADWDLHYRDMPGKTAAKQCLNTETLIRRYQMHQTLLYRNMGLIHMRNGFMH